MSQETFEQVVVRIAEETLGVKLNIPQRTKQIAIATRLRDELAKGQEPVGEVLTGCGGVLWLDGMPNRGTKLYARPFVAAPTGVPDGWKMVPVKPTVDMVDAALEAHDHLEGEEVDFRNEFCHTYRSMLSASPAAPADAVAKDADGFPWVSLADARRTELFNECRGIIGTENFGQDDALFRALAHFNAAMQGKESKT